MNRGQAKVLTRAIVYKLQRRLTGHILAANASIWGFTERQVPKLPILHTQE
jgi:hypothetical protein